MKWIAPTERDVANNTLERNLWDAADQFRANSGLTSAQYSQPILGLIFLRFAEARFTIRDEGPGFDPAMLSNPTQAENLERCSGRGLLLMRMFMDEVTFNSIGNEVTLVKRRPD